MQGLSIFYEGRGELHTACELAEQCFSLSQEVPKIRRQIIAHYALGETLFSLGEMIAARTWLEQGLRVTDNTEYLESKVPCLLLCRILIDGQGHSQLCDGY